MNPLSIELNLVRQIKDAESEAESQEISAVDYLQQLSYKGLIGVRTYSAIRRALYYFEDEDRNPRHLDSYVALQGVKTGKRLSKVAKEGFWILRFGRGSLLELQRAVIKDGSFR